MLRTQATTQTRLLKPICREKRKASSAWLQRWFSHLSEDGIFKGLFFYGKGLNWRFPNAAIRLFEITD